MVTITPVLPMSLLVLYYAISLMTFILCLILFVAIKRTKKTPYATKLLSMGLLLYDCLFLISSCAGKLFTYEDSYYVQHLSRGFQIAGQTLVLGMGLERLFVLNWPYVYLRVVSSRVIRNVCVVIFLVSFLQYVVIRGLVCYSINRMIYCGKTMSVYFISLCCIFLVISVFSYGKIYRIVRQKESTEGHRLSLLQYKGTLTSFVYLINATVTQLVHLGISVFFARRAVTQLNGNGLVLVFVDSAYLVSCIIDPLIYVLVFKATRLEVWKLVAFICPSLKPRIEAMRVDVYNITVVNSSSDLGPVA